MTIQWKDYLKVDGEPLQAATDADLDDLQRQLNKTLPADFREFIKRYQGKTPVNFMVTLPGGAKPGLTCFLHVHRSGAVPESLRSYSINWLTNITEEELEHENIVVFADSGNSRYALDYSLDDTKPSIVFIDGDYEADEPQSKVHIANSISEFLAKYET